MVDHVGEGWGGEVVVGGEVERKELDRRWRRGAGEGEGGNNVITSAAAPAPPRFLWCL